MASDKQLKHWFAKFNRDYFEGALPADTKVYWEPISTDVGMACPVYEVADGKFEIKLDPSTMGFPKYWKINLLHECVHVAVWRKHPRHQHGKVFQDEMLRLAQAGAMRKLW